MHEHWGKDVVHCPYCHGYEVRNASIGVLGGDNRPFTLHRVSPLRQWSPDVVFFPYQITMTDKGRERLTACGIGIVDGPVARLVTRDDRLHGSSSPTDKSWRGRWCSSDLVSYPLTRAVSGEIGR